MHVIMRSLVRASAACLVILELTGCGGPQTLEPAHVPTTGSAPGGVLAPAQDASAAADTANDVIDQQEQDVNVGVGQ